ncbi:MAG: hypothetical protein K2X81_02595 [Candidatus Obscuribacterales bacterium]|nr:hypothetical protein [Candidatus Obscuribacterales bacterium]
MKFRPLVLLLVFLTIGVVLAAQSASARESEATATYLKYYATLAHAQTMTEMAPFLPERQRAEFLKNAGKGSALRDLAAAQESLPADLKVLYTKCNGNHAVLESTGMFSSPELDKKTVQRWASVRMVKEFGAWKMAQESWFEHPLQLAPLRDVQTLKWCADAAVEAVPTSALSGNINGKSQKLASASFHPKFHVLTISTYSSLDDSTISLQFPESVVELNGLQLLKPGAMLSGFMIGCKTDTRGISGSVQNLLDNDDPYGMKLQCSKDATGCLKCRLNLRFPNASKSYLSGTFPVEVRN